MTTKGMGGAVLIVLFFAATASATPFAYVTNYSSGDVSVIDIATKTVVSTIPIGGIPFRTTFHPTQAIVYITNYDGPISIVDGATHAVIHTGDGRAFQAAVDPETGRLYVTRGAGGGQNVDMLDATTLDWLAMLITGELPSAIVIDPKRKRLYVGNLYSDTVSVIDSASFTVIATVPIGRAPAAMALDPNGSYLYVANISSDDVAVFSLEALKVIKTISIGLGSSPHDIGVNAEGTRIYTSNGFGSSISVIDGTTFEVVAAKQLGFVPYGLAVHEKQLYVADGQGNVVTVWDTATLTLVGEIPVGEEPAAIAIGGPPAPPMTMLTASVSGKGTVSTVPIGLMCPPACEADFATGSIVELRAEAQDEFSHWEGACNDKNPVCAVQMNGTEMRVTAVFAAVEVLLSVSVRGRGVVVSSPAGIDCPGDCTENLPSGTVVELVAKPKDGSRFVRWKEAEACQGKSPVCTIQMDGADQEVTAVFRRKLKRR